MAGDTASTNDADLSAVAALWYRQGDDTKGPISASDLRALVRSGFLNPATLIWHQDFGDQWKALDQTDFRISGKITAVPPPLLPTPATVPPKWKGTFEKFDREQAAFYYSRSFWGLLFGPLYYFYLRMWRKGFVLIGLSMCISLIVSVLTAVLDLPPLQKYEQIGIHAFCGVFATRDFYRMHRIGEKMWPSLAWFNNVWAIVALNLVPVILASVLLSYVADAQTSDASTGSALASSDGATVEQPPRSAVVPQSKTVASLDEAHYEASHKLAEQNCAQWLQQVFGGASANQYDEKTVYTYKVDLRGGDIAADASFFGGHRTMYFSANLLKYVNGVLRNRSDLPGHVCVLRDDLEVIGVEDSYTDGLK